MSASLMRSLFFAVILSVCLSIPAWAQDDGGFLPLERPAPEMLEPAKPEIETPKPGAPIPDLKLETESGPSAGTSIDPKDIPDILMKEVEEIERNCNYNTLYASYHDCRCIAVKFLDARLNSNPEGSRDAIYQRVANECPNEPGIAGYIYKGCVDVMQYARPKDFDTFCTCAANSVARNYTSRPAMNMRYIDNLRKKAFISCGIGEQPEYQTRP